ncbi:SAV_2336 N-terminal domain-related protein [Streptomyces hebeiensis]
MSSDRGRAGLANELAALRAVLAAAGGEQPTGRELAEVLWLASHVLPEPGPPEADGEAHGAWTERERHRTRSVSPGPDDPVALHLPVPAEAAPPPPDPDANPPGAGASGVLVPAPPMVAHPLAVQRALRPLRTTVPSPRERQLDEAGTAHRIASLGAGPIHWFPELRPVPERWLHLHLVVDGGPTMAMWEPLARDLHTAFGQTGAFRTVDVVRLGADGNVPLRQWTAGRTVTLVISDAMGPQWYAGAAGRTWYRTLSGWARRMPVAVLQPLPERMWRHTPPAPVPGVFSTPGPGVPNASLRFTPYDRPAAGVPVPFLEPTADWLGNWAALVASSGGTEFPGAAALLGDRPPAGSAPAVRPGGAGDGVRARDVPPEELVLRFRAVASPRAARLAAHLAVGPPHVPVMRLIQATVEEHPEPQHLAEVVLSGMLTTVPGPPGSYDFRPGVRELLLGTLTRTELVRTVGLLTEVGAVIESRAGAAPGEFRALLRGGAGGAAGAPGSEPFALVSRESVRLLRGPEVEPSPDSTAGPAPGYAPGPGRTAPAAGPAAGEQVLAGRYRLREMIGQGSQGSVWRAQDLAEDRLVAVRCLDVSEGRIDAVATRHQARLYRDTRATARLHHRGITGVHDFGVDGDTFYVVMELLEGQDLATLLTRAGGRGLPVVDIADIGVQVLDALSYAHQQGIWHQHLTPKDIVRLADGTVKVLGFGVARVGLDSSRTSQVARGAGSIVVPAYMSPEQIGGDGVDHRSDLYSLGCVLYELATGAPPFALPNTWETLRAHREVPPLSPRELRPELPAWLATALVALLAKNPEERWLGADRLRSGAPPDGRWQYGVLGPLRARRGSLDRTPGAPYERLLLARLLMARGWAVSFEELAEALGLHPWEMDTFLVPEGVRRLQELGHPVEGTSDRYRLRTDETEVDLLTAERLASEAAAAAEIADHSRAAELYDEALALWYGAPLDGLDGGAWVELRRGELTDWRRDLKVARDRAWLRAASAPAPADVTRPAEAAETKEAGEAAETEAEGGETAEAKEAEGAREPASEPITPPAGRGDDLRLVIGGTELHGVDRPANRAQAALYFAPRLRAACQEFFGDGGTRDPATSPHALEILRVTPRPEQHLAEVLELLTGPFAERVAQEWPAFLFPLPSALYVFLHSGDDEEFHAAQTSAPALSELGGLWSGRIYMVLGLPDDLYRRAGRPEGYHPYEKELSAGTFGTVWYRAVDYAPPPTVRAGPSWLRRLFGWGGRPNGRAEPS